MATIEPKRNVYVGHRYVPLILGQWLQTETYEGLSIVTHLGDSYTSKKRVPIGIPISNEEYWVLTGNYNAQIDQYRQDVNNFKDDLTEQMADIVAHMEIEPDDLRTSDTETDGDLLQKAFTMVEGAARRTLSIKLGRVYKVDKAIMLTTSISYKNNPHLIINGTGGGLELVYEGFMFDGVKNSGGLHFQNVKITGTSTYAHALFNCDNLIQIIFHGCHFSATNTILYANEIDGYIQSGRFHSCNFKGMRTHQIVAAMVYDMVITGNIVEWGHGGLIKLTQQNILQYCSIGLAINNNVLEGISGQSPIVLTHNGRCTISNNYFEGNTFTDIDMQGGVLPHRGISIKDNSFGDFTVSANKTCCVKVGKLYTNQGYNFSGNSGVKLIFDFTDSGGKMVNLTGGRYLYSGALNYIGISNDDVFYGSLTKKSAKVPLLPVGKTFEYPFSKIGQSLLSESLYVKFNFHRTGSTLYSSQYAGYLYFVSGYNAATSQIELEARFKPILIQTGHSFTEDTNLLKLTFTFKSTGLDKIPFTSKDTPISDSIVFTSVDTIVSSADSGYVINMDSLIIN